METVNYDRNKFHDTGLMTTVQNDIKSAVVAEDIIQGLLSNFIPSIFSPGASRTWILDLEMMGWMFYHCATSPGKILCVVKNNSSLLVIHLSYNWHFVILYRDERNSNVCYCTISPLGNICKYFTIVKWKVIFPISQILTLVYKTDKLFWASFSSWLDSCVSREW